MNKFALIGKFTAQIGKGNELKNILLQASQLVSTAKGLQQYLIYSDAKDADAVWVSEIWDSKQDHDDSLQIEGCKELISQAIPLLAARPESHELELAGGKII